MKQLMHLSGESVITLGSFNPVYTNFTSSITRTLYNAQEPNSRNFLPAFSISIESMRSTPSPDEFTDPVSPSEAARPKTSSATDNHKSGHELSDEDIRRQESNSRMPRSSVLVQVESPKTNDNMRQHSLPLVQDSAASKHGRGRTTSSSDSLSLVLTNPEITEIDLTERYSSEEVTDSSPLNCVPTGLHNLNEGEEKDLWDKEKANDETTESGSLNLPGEETIISGNGSSNSGSLQAASDNSEDSHGVQVTGTGTTAASSPPANKSSSSSTNTVADILPTSTLMLPTTENNSRKGTTGESSTFLFIGPVGKKRRYCRDRQKSGDMESGDSPPSLPPHTPTGSVGGGGGPDSLSEELGDPSPEQTNAEESGDSGSASTSSVIRSSTQPPLSNSCKIELTQQQQTSSSSTSSVITSTPTPVIRSVPPISRRREAEQPLNLSLPSPSEAPGNFTLSSPSSRRGENRLRVSVISLASRRGGEREDIEWDYYAQEFTSPGQQSIYSGQSPVESSGGEQTLLNTSVTQDQLSPLPSAQHHDVHSISSSSAAGIANNLAFGGAAAAGGGQVHNFQGLFEAHGIVGPSSLGRQGQVGQVQVATSGGGSGRGSMTTSSGIAIPGPSGTQKRKLQCKDCNKEFSQLRNYRYHRSRHEGSDQFACECPVCGKKFNDKGYLSSHLKIHRNAKEYKCEWCEKSFNQRVAYNMHVRIHTGHKPHKCPICPKAFSRKMLLRQHLRTHTGERPYKCEICGKAFADRSNMLLHQRLHSGQRPYKCDICCKTFSKNHHLKTHLNHHAGIKPYQCSKCKACFSQSSNMKTHFKKCTGVANSSSCTATSGSLQQGSSGMIMSGSSGGSNMMLTGPSSMSGGNLSLPGHSLPSPNTIPRYKMTEQAREELQLHQQQQQQFQQQNRILSQQEFQQLNQAQQQLLLRELTQPSSGTSGSSSLLGMSSLSPHSSQSGSGSQSFANQISQVQSLGFNMGMLGIATQTGGAGRSRRGTSNNSGMSILPMASPSPTSLAAGHPLIPLASVENASGISTGSNQPNPLLMLSPRQHHTNIDLNAATLSQLQALTQQASSNQRRMLSSRLRASQQQQEFNFLSLHQQQLQSGDGSLSQLISPSQRPSPQRGSPQRLISPRQNQSGSSSSSMFSPEHYELVLPAFAVSRNLSSSAHQSQVPFEQFAQPPRSHSFQNQLRSSGAHGGQHSHSQSSLLTVARSSASATITSLPSEEDFFNAQDQSEFMDPSDVSTRDTNWRNNRDLDNSRFDDYKTI